MLETFTEKFPNADVCAMIVWIPILEKDSLEEAVPSLTLLNDRRFCHYYDQNRLVGRAIADSVGWTSKTAWDIYLFYKQDRFWGEDAPEPSYWMHQVSELKDDKYRTGADLKNELLKSIKSLLA